MFLVSALLLIPFIITTHLAVLFFQYFEIYNLSFDKIYIKIQIIILK